MKILGIETSCDETALALVEASGGLRAPRFKILKNLVASQIKIHRPFGGVVPNLAKREHLKNLPILFKKLLPTTYGSTVLSGSPSKDNLPHTIDMIAVTVGPGLEPALWTGIEFAKTLTDTDHTQTNAEKIQRKLASSPRKSAKPIRLVGANHLEGHLYSFLLPKKTVNSKSKILNPKGLEIRNLKLVFPAIALLVSGGHTILLKMESLGKWKKLGETRDDAAGEAFDKVARLLELPYPGGPEIEKLAAKGNPFAITFPRPMLDQKNYDFSFSGLKTSVLYHLRDNPDANKADVAASFQQAAVDTLVAKVRRAAEEIGAESITLSGGVAANKNLRKALKRTAGLIGVQFFVPDFKYNVDNAVMIAVAGYMAHLRRKKYKLVAQGNLSI
jgi:N6-L-threonylcarbamoyladenine synthase